MNEYNDNREKHGPWEEYYSNGNLCYKGNYIDGKRHGLYERYSNSGKSYIKQYYI